MARCLVTLLLILSLAFPALAGPGTLDILGELSLTNTASVVLEIGGTGTNQYDRVQIAGDFYAGGTLTVLLTNSFVPAYGDSFDLFDFAYARSPFATVALPALTAGLVWNSAGLYTTGTLVVDLDPAADYDNDSMPNGWESAFGLSPTNAADASVDADADGLTNRDEYRAGTNPTNRQSVLQVTAIAVTNHDIQISWQLGRGRTNRVQISPDLVGTSFWEVGPVFFLPGSGDGSTSYVDVGGATSAPARFYRVRSVP